MYSDFNLINYIKQLELSTDIRDCVSVPIPDIAENQNYIFISYSHKDYKEVYADLAVMYQAGVPTGRNGMGTARENHVGHGKGRKKQSGLQSNDRMRNYRFCVGIYSVVV